MLIISRYEGNSFFVGNDYWFLKSFDRETAILELNKDMYAEIGINEKVFDSYLYDDTYNIMFMGRKYYGQATFGIDAPECIKIIRSELLFLNNSYYELRNRLYKIDPIQAKLCKKIANRKMEKKNVHHFV